MAISRLADVPGRDTYSIQLHMLHYFKDVHRMLMIRHWVLLKRTKESNGWQNYRLCVLGTIRKKRSYWIAWNPIEQRFAEGPEENHMNRYNVGLKQHLKEYLSKSTATLQDTTAKEDRVSNAMEALDRLWASNPFDRAN